MRNRKVLNWTLVTLIVILSAVFIYYLPPVHDRLAWRLEELVLRVKYQINPPEEIVFTPQEQAELLPTHTPVPTHNPTATPTPGPTDPGPTATPTSSATPTITPMPLPGQALLQGVRYDDQHGRFNYCAPANLSMALSYWGWQGDKDTLGPVVKPDPKDKNVMPYELADYVLENTDLGVVVRVGGDLDTIRRFISSGYPVLVEKGTFLTDLAGVYSWMGHYLVVTGYDDEQQEFTTQDSYRGPDHIVPYDEMERNWRAFNYTYLIIYPFEEQEQVFALLGEDVDETTNYQRAAQRASDEIFALQFSDQFFAWFNRGTNLMYLQDYAGAAEAYDNAFAVYEGLDLDNRPWRMLWYQTGPYFAYYYSQRYWDVLNLADTTLIQMQSDKNLEETYYWRGMAKAALGDTAGAIGDFRASLQYHPGFEPAIYQLEQLGASP